ncbi:nucleoporin 88 isoform X1 [Amyelois transitella]|uniref:nucleoporin 88 isoform X1 n=1 Tax=Amyelois transitella TaxID=680683 RepID=UPI00299034AF|nr:nucleoporin 88 isoform X1 [Amyelois transitella]
MDSRFFETKLVNHKIFADIKDSLTENPSGKLCNLMELRDDVLYLWNSKENCLFALNLKHLEEHDEETPYQKLHLLSPPAFQVERVISSACGSRLCVWGSRGVTVAELPSRWGRGGLFESGSQTVLCKSHTLDERFLYSQGEVRRVHWHPTSLSHLMVLVSDNTIRLYNIAIKSGPKLVKILTIGAKPCSQLAGRTILDSLGDTAVDFTTLPTSEDLLILRGNGDVYMMRCELDTKSGVKPILSGPLAMYPPADDNYGSESCSIAAVGAHSPALVVVATCSAALYHCLLLPHTSEKDDSDTHALYVVEAVELNIALNPDQDMEHSYPVHLYPCTSNTYACVHAGGVHSVSVPLLAHLRDYALADDEESETALSSLWSKTSVARHLVCTAGARGRPPAALAALAPPLPAALVLCPDGRLLYRTLEPYDLEEELYKELQLKNPALEDDDIASILKERQKMSFTAIIQEILTRDVSQPILNVNKAEEPSPKESLEIVTQATMKLRAEYMSRQQRACDALHRKLHALQALMKQHQSWAQDLQAEINDAHLQSAVLQEKCALAEKHQDDIKYRCSAVIRKMRGSTATSAAERELLAELTRYKGMGERLRERINMLQLHARNKTDEVRLLFNSTYNFLDIFNKHFTRCLLRVVGRTNALQGHGGEAEREDQHASATCQEQD